jgi:hypothetical protein
VINPNDLTTWHLANLADCGSPDRPDRYGLTDAPAELPEPSAGALFLRSVADGYRDARDYYLLDDGATLADWCAATAGAADAHEVADAAPSVYTFTRWQEFVDLAAWQEDVSEMTDGSDDMTTAAGICLYLIAERLFRALVDEDRETIDDEDGEA